MRLFTTTFFVLLCSNLVAQSGDYDDGILILRTGDSLLGQVKLSNQTEIILFKKNGQKKKTKFDSRKVKKVIMEGYDSNTYEFKILGNGSKPKLLKEIVINNKLSLLKDNSTYLKIASSPNIGGKGSNLNFEKKLKPIWYVARNNSSFVEEFPSDRMELIRKFNHCQAIVRKYKEINDKEFYLVEFFKDYLENCEI